MAKLAAGRHVAGGPSMSEQPKEIVFTRRAQERPRAVRATQGFSRTGCALADSEAARRGLCHLRMARRVFCAARVRDAGLERTRQGLRLE